MGGAGARARASGHTPAGDVNYAIDLLDEIVDRKKLPPKVLIVHQFTMNMLPDKQNVKDSPVVDVALVMDGWGGRAAEARHLPHGHPQAARARRDQAVLQEGQNLIPPRTCCS